MADISKGLVPIKEGDGSPNVQFLDSMANLVGTKGASTGDSGTQAFGSGMEGLQSVLDHYTKLMNGSTGDIVNSSPETQTVLSQYDAARTSMANLTPRGGMRASQGANLKFKELGDIGNLVQKTRQDATAGAGATAGAITNAGLGEQGMGLQQLMASMQTLLSQRGQNVQSDTANKELAGSLAKSAASLLI